MEEVRNKKNRVLMMGINFSPELTGIGKYSGEMAEWFSVNGYHCTVVTSFPYYPYWKIQAPYTGRFYRKEVRQQGNLEIYRCPLYVPAAPTGMRRILQDFSFLLSSFFVVIYLLFKPKHDYIFCMAPPFHLGFLALLYRFIKGGKLVYHVHDLQIEAARDFNILRVKSLFNVLFGLERIIINRADFVSTISAGMIEKIAKKTNKDIILFPNWVDTHTFRPIEDRHRLKTEWGFNRSDSVVLYSGSIGEKQGLDSLISIAKRLATHPSIKFVICGNGPYKDRLMQLAMEKKLTNMTFLPLQPLEKFNRFLNMTDVHLVLQRKSACDLMMPSKLTAIWAAGGLALVTAEPGTTLHTTISRHRMAIVIDCENETLLGDTILECCTGDHRDIASKARTYAVEYLSREHILFGMMERISNRHPTVNQGASAPARVLA